MSPRSLSKVFPLLAVAAAALFVTVPASAAGDAAKGQKLGYTCLGCHGIDTYKNVYPTFSVPRLRGQNPEYIVAALQGYANGDRNHATMHAHAASLSEQDMQDIAAYLSGEVVKSSGQDTVGTVPASATSCLPCHGKDGVGLADIYPTISGQHADYMEHALESYVSGARKNEFMDPVVRELSPEDIKELAEFYSKQKPALQTVPRREKLTASK
jgi:cytochrome c553